LTDSFANIWFTVTCLPTSRRNSSTVVDQLGLQGTLVEIEHAGELGSDRGEIAVEVGAVEQIPLLGSTTRIADHSRGPAGERNRDVAEQLEAAQQQQRHQVAHVQAVGRRVEAGVDRDRSLPQAGPQELEVGVVLYETARREVVDDLVACSRRLLTHAGHFLAPLAPGPFGNVTRGPAQ
jgi:hypothetical protein